jgi:hypothetical protein
VITALLALTTITLISQRQRTVLLNKQIAALLGETTRVLRRAGPALDALPRQSSTVASRARAAADLIAETRPLVAGLRKSDLPQTLSTAGQLLQSIGPPSTLAHTLANLDAVSTDANQTRLIPRFVPLLNEVPAASHLISQTRSLETSLEGADLISRAVAAFHDLETMVRLQQRTLAIQEATLQTGRQTQALTSQMLARADRLIALATALLDVARQTLGHTTSLDNKVP